MLLFHHQVSLVEDVDDPNEHINIKIKNIIRHPEYVRQKKYNDIALIELEHDVKFTYFAHPACLYHPETTVLSQMYITGWGRVSSDNDALSGWLLEGKVNETDFSNCKAQYDNLGQSGIPEGLQKASQFCATGNNNGQTVDACQGDSGGPLQYKARPFVDDIGFIYGIVSFGAGCGNENYVGVSQTLISEFRICIISNNIIF